MARRRGFKRGGRSRGLGGKMGMFAPVLAGIADNVVDSYIPVIDGIGSTAVGFVLKNEFSKNMGLYRVGFSLGNMLPIPRGGGATGQTGGLL